MPSSGKRRRLAPDVFTDHYQQPLRWDRLRERMAEAVEKARTRSRVPPMRGWEKDWSKKP